MTCMVTRCNDNERDSSRIQRVCFEEPFATLRTVLRKETGVEGGGPGRGEGREQRAAGAERDRSGERRARKAAGAEGGGRGEWRRRRWSVAAADV